MNGVDRETAVTIMQQTYGHRGLASMALDQADVIERLREALRRIRDRDWKPVTITEGGESLAMVSASDIDVAREIARLAIDEEDR